MDLRRAQRVRPQSRRWRKAVLPEWWPVLAGLLSLFVPTFADLFTGAWIGEEQGHGPIIFGLALWLIARKWPDAGRRAGASGAALAGWPLLAFGLRAAPAGALAAHPDVRDRLDHRA